MVCCRLSAVGFRCSNVCTKTCITCLMLEKSRKNQKKSRKTSKKRKKCRRTQITLFINQQMLLHTVRREVTHFFPFKIHVRKNAVRTFFRAFFCTQESFWTFFSESFSNGFFCDIFPFTCQTFLMKDSFGWDGLFTQLPLNFFLNSIERAIEFLLTSKVCLLWIRRKTPTYIQIGQ